METLLQADIFFFISSAATVVLTIALLILIYYLIRLAREIESLSQRTRQEISRISDKTRIMAKFIKVATSFKFLKRILRDDEEKE